MIFCTAADTKASDGGYGEGKTRAPSDEILRALDILELPCEWCGIRERVRLYPSIPFLFLHPTVAFALSVASC